MAISRDNLQFRVPKPVKAALRRLCQLTERSQTKFIEIVIREEEQNWLRRLTEDQRERYFAGQLNLCEAAAAVEKSAAPACPKCSE
jgi:hypothetical protein